MSPRGDLPTLLIHGGPDTEHGEGGSGGSSDTPTSSEFSDPSVCTACHEEGTLLLCEGKGCKQELHFDCADPPLTAAEVDEIERWYCGKCEYRGEPERQAYEEAVLRMGGVNGKAGGGSATSSSSQSRASGKRGSLAGPGAASAAAAAAADAIKKPSGKPAPVTLAERLLDSVSQLDSRQFSLPDKIRNHFEGVSTSDKGTYFYRPPFKQVGKRARGINYLTNDMNLPIEKRIFDNKGFIITCYHCGKGKREGHNFLLSCDYCRFNWHIDCLPYPMPSAPSVKDGKIKKWKCPLHADDDQLPALKRVRLAKCARFEDIDIHQFEGGDFWFKEFSEGPNGEKYEVPVEGIRLRWDYLGVQKKYLKQKEQRQAIAKSVHDRKRMSTPLSTGVPLSSRSTTPKTPSGFDSLEGMNGNGNAYSTTTTANGTANGIGNRTPASSIVGSAIHDAAMDLETYRREDIEGVLALAELGQAGSSDTARRSSSVAPPGSSPPPPASFADGQQSSPVNLFIKDADEITKSLLNTNGDVEELQKLEALKTLIERRMVAIKN